MTQSNGNNGDRLNQIENILDRLAVGLEETRAIANSNSRNIQGILEQQATDSLRREEEKAQHEQRMARLEDLMASLVSIEQGQNRMLGNIDEDRPTMLRRLMAIENKVDTLIERNQ
ncbi:MAG: hypothetical protein AAGA16_08540 [Cyanobacteria bacterium P01_E01_bin.35]